MIHPHTRLQFISDGVGYGVVATERIPKGTITWAKDPLDQTLSPGDIDALDPVFRPHLDHFTFRDNQGNYVLCWDHCRYMNHSVFPTCITTAYGFELAVRDIEAGQELTNDYGFLNLDVPFECFPEAGSDRTRILPDDLVRYHPEWDRQLQVAFRSFRAVEQPLAFLVDTEAWAEAMAVSRGEAEMASIQALYFAGTPVAQPVTETTP